LFELAVGTLSERSSTQCGLRHSGAKYYFDTGLMPWLGPTLIARADEVIE